MFDYLVENEAQVRGIIFLSVLTLMWIWQSLKPRRAFKVKASVRWTNNMALVFFNSFVVRLIFPAATLGVASWALENQWGLFSLLHWPWYIELVLAIVILDLIIYWQHRLFHKVPFLWALHKVHHVDQDIDVTTGSRFHTIEIILSLLIKFALVCLLGPSLLAVILFEIILNACAMFNHANVKLPLAVDKIFRFILVTPDMHRVHHSTIGRETNSNFGFNITWWDKIFGSYQGQPKLGHDNMNIGVKGYEDIKQTQYLPFMLWLPFSQQKKEKNERLNNQ